MEKEAETKIKDSSGNSRQASTFFLFMKAPGKYYFIWNYASRSRTRNLINLQSNYSDKHLLSFFLWRLQRSITLSVTSHLGTGQEISLTYRAIIPESRAHKLLPTPSDLYISIVTEFLFYNPGEQIKQIMKQNSKLVGTYILTSTRRKLLSAPAMHSTSGSFLSDRKGNQSSSNTRVPGNWGCKSELANGSGESCKWEM